jgi:hypothetical protein
VNSVFYNLYYFKSIAIAGADDEDLITFSPMYLIRVCGERTG